MSSAGLWSSRAPGLRALKNALPACYTEPSMKLLSWLQDPGISSESEETAEPPLAPELHNRLTELKDQQVKEAMIPRALVTALDADVQLRRVRRLKSSKVTYFPVYKGDLDHILGWISKGKVLELLNEPNEEVRLADHVKAVGEVQEDASVASLADVFLKSASPFLVVKNQQGTTTGIVPLSEFVELVFGFELGPSAQTPASDLALRGYEI
jgi:CBS domain containing-hemolysin-like protein